MDRDGNVIKQNSKQLRNSGKQSGGSRKDQKWKGIPLCWGVCNLSHKWWGHERLLSRTVKWEGLSLRGNPLSANAENKTTLCFSPTLNSMCSYAKRAQNLDSQSQGLNGWEAPLTSLSEGKSSLPWKRPFCFIGHPNYSADFMLKVTEVWCQENSSMQWLS